MTQTTMGPRGPKPPRAAVAREKFHEAFGNAEQFPAQPTIIAIRRPDGNRLRFADPVPTTGKARQKCPQAGCSVWQDGDVVAIGSQTELDACVRLLFWRGAWHVVPSTDALMEWSMDGTCPTPDGSDRLEPDAPDSWLSLLGVV